MSDSAIRPSPIKSIPYGLVSLWDMINFELGYLLSVMNRLGSIMRSRTGDVSHGDFGTYKHHITEIKDIADQHGFKRTASLAGSAKISIEVHELAKEPLQYDKCFTEMDYILKAIKDDTYEHKFYHYPLDKSKELIAVDDQWGIVIKKFKDAEQDLREGIDCFALGCNTAAVFHMMRAAEHGLRAVAKERKITKIGKKPLSKSQWGSVIAELNKEIGVIEKKASPGKRKDEAMEFYKEAVAHAIALKNKYRNDVMHANVTFSETEAADAIFHTKSFMQGLTKKLSGKSRQSINWKLSYPSSVLKP